jgi:shikimate kinase
VEKRSAVRSGELLSRGAVKAIFLVGFMGAGKSSAGQALARLVGWSFEDLDDRIQRRERRTVADIFRTSGEPGFRRAEQAALAEVLEELESGSAMIVALGGGAFVQETNATRIAASGIPTVFLDAPVEELWRRCSGQAGEIERPLLRSREHFQELYQARRSGYLKASHELQTSGKDVESVAVEIVRTFDLKHRSGA